MNFSARLSQAYKIDGIFVWEKKSKLKKRLFWVLRVVIGHDLAPGV